MLRLRSLSAQWQYMCFIIIAKEIRADKACAPIIIPHLIDASLLIDILGNNGLINYTGITISDNILLNSNIRLLLSK